MNTEMKKSSSGFDFRAVNISKAYNGIDVVKDFNLDISNGEVIGIVGDNGAGKSTIMRIAALVDSMDSGELLFNGKNAKGNVKQLRAKIGYIPQSNALIEEMTAIDNLKLFSMVSKQETKKKIEELSDAFHMDKFLHKKVKHLSGGMHRRVNIAAGLINSPKLLVADEPFAGLDATQRSEVISYFKKLSKQGVGQLISSHYIENLETWANNIITI